MALFMLRRWCRVPPHFSFASASLRGSVVLTRSTRAKLPPPSPAAAAARTYSSDQGPEIKAMLEKIQAATGPVFWVRTRVYYLMIKLFFDKDFNGKRFIEGAKQAFSHVSRLLSRGQFDALAGLMDEELLGVMKRNYKTMPLHDRQTLAAEHILSAKPIGVEIYKDAFGRRFVDIQMLFYYRTGYDSEIQSSEMHYQIPGNEKSGIKSLQLAIYQFQMELNRNVRPHWTITEMHYSFRSHDVPTET